MNAEYRMMKFNFGVRYSNIHVNHYFYNLSLI